ncbi:hypothetical protein [Reichenbachiella sp.]|uniref:hypothetical protein n=1 Tax=Reichenbachiella sp. TaxID=2184521 RepID=UPI003B5C6DB7
MLKLTFIGATIWFASLQIAFSQERVTTELKPTQVRALFLCPGISIEQRLSDKHSFNLIAGIQPGISTYTLEPDGTKYDFYIAPFVSGEIRNYYDRKKVNKDLAPNSGNYVALAAGYYMDRIINDSGRDYYEESYENSYFIGPVWGFQRNYMNGFHLNISVGLGYQQGDQIEGSIGMITSGGVGFYF